jgi:predicted transcriptional regulator YheO
MNKKSLSLLLSFSVVVALYLFNKEQPQIGVSVNNQDSQRTIDKKFKSVEQSTSSAIKTVHNKAPLNHKRIKEQEKKVYSLSQCLIKNSCGMKPLAGDPYFDEAEVRGSKELKKLLRTMVKSNTTFTLPYKNLFKLPNEQIKIDALKLFIGKKLTDRTLSSILSQKASFTGSAQALMYKELLNKYHTENQHEKIIRSLIDSLENSDSFMVMRIIEESKYYRLTENEFKDIIQGSCRFKTSEQDQHNWKMVRYALNESIRENNYRLNIDSICP